MVDKAALRESVEMEARSDLCAAGRDLTGAIHWMREANATRAAVFGRLTPNELREKTLAALNPEGVLPD